MSLMFVTALLLAQAPAAVQPAPAQQQAVKKAKPAQICEYLEITGSRAKRRVCHDAAGNLDLGPGVSSSLSGKGRMDSPAGSAGNGPG